MSRVIAQKKYYKLSFSVDVETAEDVTWIREHMDKLETEPLIMRCFQNVTVSEGWSNSPNISRNDYTAEANAFSIYFREENNKPIERFLFKVKLKFPNFKHEFTQTVKEYT